MKIKKPLKFLIGILSLTGLFGSTFSIYNLNKKQDLSLVNTNKNTDLLRGSIEIKPDKEINPRQSFRADEVYVLRLYGEYNDFNAERFIDPKRFVLEYAEKIAPSEIDYYDEPYYSSFIAAETNNLFTYTFSSNKDRLYIRLNKEHWEKTRVDGGFHFAMRARYVMVASDSRIRYTWGYDMRVFPPESESPEKFERFEQSYINLPEEIVYTDYYNFDYGITSYSRSEPNNKSKQYCPNVRTVSFDLAFSDSESSSDYDQIYHVEFEQLEDFGIHVINPFGIDQDMKICFLEKRFKKDKTLFRIVVNDVESEWRQIYFKKKFISIKDSINQNFVNWETNKIIYTIDDNENVYDDYIYVEFYCVEKEYYEMMHTNRIYNFLNFRRVAPNVNQWVFEFYKGWRNFVNLHAVFFEVFTKRNGKDYRSQNMHKINFLRKFKPIEFEIEGTERNFSKDRGFYIMVKNSSDKLIYDQWDTFCYFWLASESGQINFKNYFHVRKTNVVGRLHVEVDENTPTLSASFRLIAQRDIWNKNENGYIIDDNDDMDSRRYFMSVENKPERFNIISENKSYKIEATIDESHQGKYYGYNDEAKITFNAYQIWKTKEKTNVNWANLKWYLNNELITNTSSTYLDYNYDEPVSSSSSITATVRFKKDPETIDINNLNLSFSLSEDDNKFICAEKFNFNIKHKRNITTIEYTLDQKVNTKIFKKGESLKFTFKVYDGHHNQLDTFQWSKLQWLVNEKLLNDQYTNNFFDLRWTSDVNQPTWTNEAIITFKYDQEQNLFSKISINFLLANARHIQGLNVSLAHSHNESYIEYKTNYDKNRLSRTRFSSSITDTLKLNFAIKNAENNEVKTFTKEMFDNKKMYINGKKEADDNEYFKLEVKPVIDPDGNENTNETYKNVEITFKKATYDVDYLDIVFKWDEYETRSEPIKINLILTDTEENNSRLFMWFETEINDQNNDGIYEKGDWIKLTFYFQNAKGELVNNLNAIEDCQSIQWKLNDNYISDGKNDYFDINWNFNQENFDPKMAPYAIISFNQIADRTIKITDLHLNLTFRNSKRSVSLDQDLYMKHLNTDQEDIEPEAEGFNKLPKILGIAGGSIISLGLIGGAIAGAIRYKSSRAPLVASPAPRRRRKVTREKLDEEDEK